jgi:hypothetical protein
MTMYNIDEWNKKERSMLEKSAQLDTIRKMEMLLLRRAREKQFRSFRDTVLVIVITAWLTWIVLSILF